MFLRNFDEFLQCLHRANKFFGKFLIFLVFPCISQAGEAGLQGGSLHLKLIVKSLKFLGEPPDLIPHFQFPIFHNLEP